MPTQIETPEASITRTVGVREFRENLSSYLESDSPIAISRYGEIVGTLVPNPNRRPKVDWAVIEESARRAQEELKAIGMTEEEYLADFKRWRSERYK